MENSINTANDIDQSQNSDKPITGGINENVVKHIHLVTPDLSAKDAGKYMNAVRNATNVYYPDRTSLYDFYIYILFLDNFLSGIIDKRHKSVLNKKIVYKHNGQKVDDMDACICNTRFRDMLNGLLWAQQFGVGGFDFIAGKEFDWRPVPVKHIKPKWQRITIEQNGEEGYDYTLYDNLWIIDNGDLGLMQTCALAAAYKKDAVGDWAELIEIFGRPTQVMWYDAFNPQVIAEIEDIQKKAGSSLRIKLPAGTKYEQHEIKGGNSTGDLQMQFIELMNKEMAVKQLGGVETTGTSKGSGHAQAEVHYKGEQELVKSNMDYLIGLLNLPHFFKIMKSYGWPVVEGGCFEFDREVDVEFLNKKWLIDQGLISSGLPVTTRYLYETYSIPEPKAGEPLLIKPQEPAPKPTEDPATTDPEQADDPELQDKPLPDKPHKHRHIALSDDTVWYKKLLAFFADALPTQG